MARRDDAGDERRLGDGHSVTERHPVAAHVGAFALPVGSRDAALLVSLPPGACTVAASGASDAVGTGLFELYVVR